MGVVAQGAGAGLKALGAYGSAQSQKSALGYQAQVDDLNAAQSENTAESALFQGQQQVQQSELRTANLKSEQRAGLAANGVDLGVGSAANILSSTDVMGQIDANTIEANAIRSAWGYREQGTNYSNQALMARAQGKAINPTLAAVTSLLGSSGSVAQSWYQANNVAGVSTGGYSGQMGALGDMGASTSMQIPAIALGM